MIGIYSDDFVDFLEENLGEVKKTSKNLVVKCPWCELNSKKSHSHLYISLETPIFHCFYAGCHQKGTISKLLKKISGKSNAEDYIKDVDILNPKKQKKQIFSSEEKRFILPEIKIGTYKAKTLYLKERLKYPNYPVENIKNLVFDIYSFFDINHLDISKLNGHDEYYNRNFIGFLTENHSILNMRNIDKSASLRYSKVDLKDLSFLDYYKIQGRNYNSNKIILAEGVFNILCEHNYDNLKLSDDCKMYAAGLSSNYESLIKSVVFYEQIFKLDVCILSDPDIKLNYYEKIKRNLDYLIDKMVVYYNSGGDFADNIKEIHKFVI